MRLNGAIAKLPSLYVRLLIRVISFYFLSLSVPSHLVCLVPAPCSNCFYRRASYPAPPARWMAEINQIGIRPCLWHMPFHPSTSPPHWHIKAPAQITSPFLPSLRPSLPFDAISSLSQIYSKQRNSEDASKREPHLPLPHARHRRATAGDRESQPQEPQPSPPTPEPAPPPNSRIHRLSRWVTPPVLPSSSGVLHSQLHRLHPNRHSLRAGGDWCPARRPGSRRWSRPAG